MDLFWEKKTILINSFIKWINEKIKIRFEENFYSNFIFYFNKEKKQSQKKKKIVKGFKKLHSNLIL